MKDERACSSSTTRPRRSSPTRPTSGRRITSRVDSDELAHVPGASLAVRRRRAQCFTARARRGARRKGREPFAEPGSAGRERKAARGVRTTFQDELDLLEATLQEEGALVLRALRGAIKALEQRDNELADEVIAFDDDIDERYVRIEEGIQSLLARQTPVASDLRLVLAILHVNLHLERMADYCVTIAKLTKLVPEVDPGPRFVEGFDEMGSRCEEMIRVALDSFGNRDLAGAESLVDLDELIDRANRRVVERILELGGDPAMREYGLRMVIVSRALERIGDHAVDIGEQTAYLLTAEFREFTDASHPPPREA